MESKQKTESGETGDEYLDDESPTKQRVGKQKGKAPRDNQKQNEQVAKVSKRLGLDKQQQRNLHDEISGQGMNFQEILQRAKEMFNLQ